MRWGSLFIGRSLRRSERAEKRTTPSAEAAATPPTSTPLRDALVGTPAAGGADEGGFDFVLEVYTIQPLPLELRPKVIDAISAFLKPGAELVVVARFREDNEEPDQLPWPLSRKDLKRFEENGLIQQHFEIQAGDEDDPMPRFVAGRVVKRRTASWRGTTFSSRT